MLHCSHINYACALQSRKMTASNILINHVVVCVFADGQSPLIGLRNLVMPLRASNFHFSELKPVVIVGDKDYIMKEWKTLCNFPKVYVIDVSRRTSKLISKSLCCWVDGRLLPLCLYYWCELRKQYFVTSLKFVNDVSRLLPYSLLFMWVVYISQKFVIYVSRLLP